MSEAADKKALLNELRIDRDQPSDGGRPLKWYVLLAIVGGVGFVLLFIDFPGADSAIPVKTAVARAAGGAAASGGSVLDATGYVVARRQATVSSKTTGKVVEVFVEEGLVVEAGQILATLDDSIPRAQRRLAESQLQSAEAALAELEVQIKQAELDLARTRGLADRNLASEADLDRDALSVEALVARLGRARKDIIVAERSLAVQDQLLADMQIRAPFAGIVVAKAAQPGEMISPVSAGGGFTRTGICTIVDMDSLEIEVDVNESYINRVYQAQPVQVTLNAYPDHAYPAEVIAIIPTADRNKATVRVRVGFVSRDERVLPDMGVRVAFLDESEMEQTQAPPSGVLVPGSSVRDGDVGAFVWLYNDGEPRKQRVTVGGKEGDRVRVLAGVDGGERVIAELSEELLASLDAGVAVTAE